ncbi:hypothetical protein H8B09_25830 [Paenibacillus sp. PR3]|uniref:3-hydroxylacyl-ACP dehydratase n=1 Tax=Paenibacillus terricola TaxID=2763503 RepID=A0ABR8N209_9BACL|nr:hypothetical protein [Paenibacillus terricola]MBD3922202.1 hypothetical protein [Paenibacillus terricola]
MRFYMVDQITYIESGKEIHATKLVTRDDPFCLDPVNVESYLIEGIVVEALCQAGAWLIMHTTEFKQRAVLLSAEEILLHERACPGDVLNLHGFIDSLDKDSAVFSGKVYVDERCIAEIRYMMCSLISVDELEKTEDVRRTYRLLRREI